MPRKLNFINMVTLATNFEIFSTFCARIHFDHGNPSPRELIWFLPFWLFSFKHKSTDPKKFEKGKKKLVRTSMYYVLVVREAALPRSSLRLNIRRDD